MTTPRHASATPLSLALSALLATGSAACAATSHGEIAGELGVPISTATLDAVVGQPGPVVVETIVGADWHVPLSGLVNLEHPTARAAHLEDREEPIQIVFHALHHPTRGLFLVDTGVERALFDDPDRAAIRGLVARFMHAADMVRGTDTGSWLDAHGGRVAGVFLTHLHLDHVSGLRDVPAGTPVFVGPGEARERSLQNAFVAPSLDRALEGKPPLAAWRFQRDPDGDLDGVLDVFGDGTVFAIHVPGHTRGSTAYLARSPSGPVLLTGDACHTAWGWDNGVEPGTYSSDAPRSAESLARLRRFAAKHPSLDVRLGHQTRGERPVAAAAP